MFIRYQTQGFVFKKLDSGETDQVFTIYTKDFGKLKILAKAIRKMTAKLKAGIPLLSLIEIEFIQAKNFKTLTDAILIDDFSQIKKDLEKLKIAYDLAELTDKLIRGEEKDFKIWRLTDEVFKHLNDTTFNPQLSTIYYYFFWNLVSILGYQPELNHCAICKKRLEPDKLYFLKEGAVCQNCRRQNALAVSVEAIKILREILKKDFQKLVRIRIKPTLLKELENISQFYLSWLE